MTNERFVSLNPKANYLQFHVPSSNFAIQYTLGVLNLLDAFPCEQNISNLRTCLNLGMQERLGLTSTGGLRPNASARSHRSSLVIPIHGPNSYDLELP